LEPGRPRMEAAVQYVAMNPGFNGARFFWNREESTPRCTSVFRLSAASMGPGSFGTGKGQGHGGGPGGRRPQRFNGARFFWNREDPGDQGVARRVSNASMGPGSFGTGKPNQLWERIRPRERSASMGPGSFGTGKSLRPESHRSTRSVPASMGPGSFGTGKCGWSSTTRGRRTIGFNGARFFWNREDSERAPGAPTSKHRFNGARFFWNREVEAAINAREVETLRASMGPGSFGTGKPPLDALPMAKGADNLASMGPGSFGTGKIRSRGGSSRLT